MMTMSLPIPGKKELLKFYYVPYHISENYINYVAEISIRSSDTWAEFRDIFEKKYGVAPGNYTITKVSDNAYK